MGKGMCRQPLSQKEAPLGEKKMFLFTDKDLHQKHFVHYKYSTHSNSRTKLQYRSLKIQK